MSRDCADEVVSRLAIATLKPARQRPSAIAKPMPRPAPVTSAVPRSGAIGVPLAQSPPSSRPANASQRLLDMRDRCFRQNAVAEVEDQRTLAVIFQDIVHRAIERRAAGEQRERIEVALHGDTALDALAHEGG